MPEQSLYQNQEQRQEQIIAPQQIQSLEYLMAQTAELQAKIDKELEENPLLEEVENSSDKPEDKITSQDENEINDSAQDEDISPDSPSDERTDSDIFENKLPFQSDSGDFPEDYNDNDSFESEIEQAGISFVSSPTSVKSNTPDYDQHRQFIMDSITSKPSLQEQLLEQLHFLNIPEEQMKIAELIVGSIDEKGFLRSHPADLATKEQVDISTIESLIKFLQEHLDPPGLCARDIKECFLLQLKAKGMEKSKIAYLVKHHLEDIAKNKKPAVAKKMKISLEELEDLIAELRKLDPAPANQLSTSISTQIIPDVFIEKKGNIFISQTNKEWSPKLRISQKYLKMLDDPLTPPETKSWIREKVNRAKNVIRSLSQRESTIKRIADLIIDEQFEFFEKGYEYLKPLTMQKIADKLGLHETTISRAISGKYMQTPRGLFEFKFFFSTGYKSESGEEMSSKSVMEKIREMIDNEDPRKPLSDQDISEKLKAQGLNVARRTVAKYREELGIQSSHLRRQHT
ncbi:MAG TPA: RNA polymerase factor sigma-54 [Victivallales bacterium]|nr:RNA polymerase factor sigma-54 [Victivallales bacterium]